MGRWVLWMLLPFMFPQVSHAVDDPYVQQLQELAGQGDGESQFALALLYEYGERGVTRDPEKAVSWFLQAGKGGIPAACLYLGIKYENGSGVGRDPGAAGRWYCCAAKQGWAMAQFLLAELYEKGKGRQQDVSLALAWYGLAEEQGYPGAREAVTRLTRDMTAAERKKAVSLRSGLQGSKMECPGL